MHYTLSGSPACLYRQSQVRTNQRMHYTLSAHQSQVRTNQRMHYTLSAHQSQVRKNQRMHYTLSAHQSQVRKNQPGHYPLSAPPASPDRQGKWKPARSRREEQARSRPHRHAEHGGAYRGPSDQSGAPASLYARQRPRRRRRHHARVKHQQEEGQVHSGEPAVQRRQHVSLRSTQQSHRGRELPAALRHSPPASAC